MYILPIFDQIKYEKAFLFCIFETPANLSINYALISLPHRTFPNCWNPFSKTSSMACDMWPNPSSSTYNEVNLLATVQGDPIELK